MEGCHGVGVGGAGDLTSPAQGEMGFAKLVEATGCSCKTQWLSFVFDKTTTGIFPFRTAICFGTVIGEGG